MRLPCSLLLIVCLAVPAVDAQAQESAPTLAAGRRATALRLDGRLNEPDWETAPVSSAFTMVEPTEGGAPTFATSIRVLTDDHHIIFGIEAFDDEPARIVSYSKARDSELRSEDHVKIVLDTFLDGRSGYVFAVNPSGARYDALVADRGEHESDDWDEVWEAATAITESGWSAEIRIPIRSLRFKATLGTWGLNVERRVQRLLETVRWSGARRDYRVTQTSLAGLLADIPRFESGIGLSIRPSVVGELGHARIDEDNGFDGEPSLDMTQLLGSGSIASLTVNTDFAETEVDTRQTNLTRFPLFFPEKRPFFLEGADIFQFGLGAGRDVLPFFSRTIGLVSGQQVPLQVGLKANGRVGGTNYGALVTRTGGYEDLVAPTEMGVVRVQQNILEQSSIGIIGTVGDPLSRSGAWTAGMDFTYQTSSLRGGNNFLVGAWGLITDRDDLGNGDRSAFGIQVSYPNDPLDISVGYMRIGDAFDPSLGFVPRRGIQKVEINGDYTIYPDISWIRSTVFEFRPEAVTDLDGNLETYSFFTAPVNVRFESGDRFEFNVVPRGDRLAEPFEIVDGVVIPAGNYDWIRYRLELQTAAKRRVSSQATWWFGSFYGGTLDQIELELNWNPSALLNFELGVERNIGNLPGGDFTLDLASFRVGVNFSPDLTLSSFVQYDNESDSLGTNTRLRWVFSPLGELFVVHNYNVFDPFAGPVSTNQLSVKLRYTFRL